MGGLYKTALASFAMLCILGSASGAAGPGYASGERLFRQEKFVAAEREWTKAAKAGDARAQYMLGLALISGKYFPLDEQAGLAYLALASGQGHGDATHALYDVRRKHGAPQPETIALLEKAAAQGSAAARAEIEMAGAAGSLHTGTAELDRMLPTRVSKLAPQDRAGALVRGRKVYEESCKVCHAEGIVNAPRPADRAAWAARNKQGLEVLVKHAIDGYRAHPKEACRPCRATRCAMRCFT